MSIWTTKFDRAIKNKEEFGTKYASAHALAGKLRRLEKFILAQQKKKYLEQGMTVGKAEIYAEASEEYLNHVLGLEVAEEDETRFKVNFECSSDEFERVRSEVGLEKKMEGQSYQQEEK